MRRFCEIGGGGPVGEEVEGSAGYEEVGDFAAEIRGVGGVGRGEVGDGHGFAVGGDDLGVNVGGAGGDGAEAADGEHAATAEGSEGGAFGGDGEGGFGVIEGADRG